MANLRAITLGWTLGVLFLAQPVQANRIQEWVTQAEQLSSNGYTAAAIELYQKAIELDLAQPVSRQKAFLHFNQALLYLDVQKFNEAKTSLEYTVIIDPNHLKGHFNLGLLYADLRKPLEAQREMSLALALAGNNAQTAAYILQVMEERGLMDKSFSAVTPGSPANPSSDLNTAPPERTSP